jgi:flagellar biosynthesis/type III secretory pathway protein FliH
MEKQSFDRIKKTFGVLMLVSFIMFVTSMSATANTHDRDASKNPNTHDRDASATEPNGYGFRDNKIGSLSGYHYGYKEGSNVGLEDCLKHRQEGVLTQITDSEINDEWTENYQKGYKKGYKNGYINGYNDARFKCLKK